MRKLICVLALLLPGMALAAGGNVHLDKANYDQSHKGKLLVERMQRLISRFLC